MSLLHIKNIMSAITTVQNDWKVSLLKNWPIIIGKLNMYITLEKIYADSIIIGVADSCWLQELYMLSPLICSLINDSLDQPRIKTIRFKKIILCDQLSKNTLIKNSVSLPKIKPKELPLNHKELFALKKITDYELQEALKNFHTRIAQGD